jgi:predicted nucleic acid-binding protein
VSKRTPKRALFDTSVLVAGMVSRHPKFEIAHKLLEQVAVGKITGLVSTHSIAETFAVLTRLPHKPMIGPQDARRLLETNLVAFEKIPLTEQDYFAVIARLEALQFSGGAIYDALIAQAALKAKAERLYSFNSAHFVRLGADVAQLVTEPG